MSKDLTIKIDEELHNEIVARSGGPRKVSRFLVPIIRSALASIDVGTNAEVKALREEIGDLKRRVQALESKRDE
jgi:polyhydroxyalkanoate synthesis regulator phasin